MSLPLPKSFHVETLPKCVAKSCERRTTSESSFCPSCWELLGRNTQRRISAAHNTRNQRCVLRYVNRGVRELEKLQKDRKSNNAVSLPTPDRSLPAPTAGPAHRARHNPAPVPRVERGAGQ